jgi:hypothetical protein
MKARSGTVAATIGLEGRHGDPLTRVFIVGFPRSGTTLVQAMLAAHPDVFTIPETHFFTKIHGRFKGRKARLVSPRAVAVQRRNLQRALPDGAPTPRSPFAHISSLAAGRAFAEAMDGAASWQGHRVWVDKSPAHLHRISEISRAIPSAKFVHVVRDGTSAAASFFARCRDDPGWIRQLEPEIRERGDRPGTPDDLLEAIAARWNRDIVITRASRGDQGHFVLPLEELLADVERHLRDLCAFLGVPFDTRMLDQTNAAPSVIGWRATYPHMLGALEPASASRPKRPEDLLSSAQERALRDALIFQGDWALALAHDPEAGTS